MALPVSRIKQLVKTFLPLYNKAQRAVLSIRHLPVKAGATANARLTLPGFVWCSADGAPSVMLSFRPSKDNRKGLTPAKGISPKFYFEFNLCQTPVIILLTDAEVTEDVVEDIGAGKFTDDVVQMVNAVAQVFGN
jgi:hypothetical protein